MRWPMRGLEAWATLPPSENHLRGDFKNIPVMLQDKSLIIGNYGLAISPSPFLAKASVSHPHYFYPLIQQEEHGCMGWRGKEGWGLLPGSREWSRPLTLYCTSIHVEWLTCGQQLQTKWSQLGLVMKWLDWQSDWLHSRCLHARCCPIWLQQKRAARYLFPLILCERKMGSRHLVYNLHFKMSCKNRYNIHCSKWIGIILGADRFKIHYFSGILNPSKNWKFKLDFSEFCQLVICGNIQILFKCPTHRWLNSNKYIGQKYFQI